MAKHPSTYVVAKSLKRSSHTGEVSEAFINVRERCQPMDIDWGLQNSGLEGIGSRPWQPSQIAAYLWSRPYPGKLEWLRNHSAPLGTRGKRNDRHARQCDHGSYFALFAMSDDMEHLTDVTSRTRTKPHELLGFRDQHRLGTALINLIPGALEKAWSCSRQQVQSINSTFGSDPFNELKRCHTDPLRPEGCLDDQGS